MFHIKLDTILTELYTFGIKRTNLMTKGLNTTLRNIPIDVRKILLKEQFKEKEKRGTMQYSISTTIFKIIREWNNKCNQ